MNILNLFGVIDVAIVIVVIIFLVIGWKSGFLLKVVEMRNNFV